MTAAVTVVIVTWNGADKLRRCLPGVRRQELSGGRTFDTVVVDNASADDTLALLAEEYPWVRVVRNARNLGFAGGNNSALRDVRTPLVALLNNDAVPEPGWLEALTAPFAEPGNEDVAVTASKVLLDQEYVAVSLETTAFRPRAHPGSDFGIRLHAATTGGPDLMRELGGVVYEPNRRFRWTRSTGEVLVPVSRPGPWRVDLTASAEREKSALVGTDTLHLDTEPRPLPTIEVPASAQLVRAVNNAGMVVLEEGSAADRGLLKRDAERYAEPCEVFGGCGNGMALRTSVGHEVGWFDEGFFLYYEDVDLSWRIRSRGWRVRYTPSAVVLHENLGSSGAGSDVHTFHDARNRLLCLVVNATPALARREVAGFLRATVAKSRDRSGVGPTFAMHLRVLRSFLRLLPRALVRRRRVGRTSTVSRADIETLFITHEAWVRGDD